MLYPRQRRDPPRAVDKRVKELDVCAMRTGLVSNGEAELGKSTGQRAVDDSEPLPVGAGVVHVAYPAAGEADAGAGAEEELDDYAVQLVGFRGG